jgi:two-component system response regulator ResD
MVDAIEDSVKKSEAGDDSPWKILVVDDEPAVRELMRLWLEREDCVVNDVAGGSEALEIINQTFDALVLDRSMPGLNGIEVYERLDETSYNGPTMVCSAVDPGGTVSEADVEMYLTKPFTQSKFLTGVKKMVGCG